MQGVFRGLVVLFLAALVYLESLTATNVTGRNELVSLIAFLSLAGMLAGVVWALWSYATRNQSRP